MGARRVIHAEALAWMAANPADSGTSVVTSLPDVSELQDLSLDAWRTWFIDAARRVIQWVPERGLAIFYQSDVRIGGKWIDKSYLINRAIEDAGASLVWHKLVCRKPPGSVALGRPSYSHMLCATMTDRAVPRHPGPDVLADAGHMPWSKAMGVAACTVACRFLREETATRVVVDPFCGRGTVLAVANAMGFDALGVDVGAKRCRAARAMVIGVELSEREVL